jgi:hypothetical protein
MIVEHGKTAHGDGKQLAEFLDAVLDPLFTVLITFRTPDLD